MIQSCQVYLIKSSLCKSHNDICPNSHTGSHYITRRSHLKALHVPLLPYKRPVWIFGYTTFGVRPDGHNDVNEEIGACVWEMFRKARGDSCLSMRYENP